MSLDFQQLRYTGLYQYGTGQVTQCATNAISLQSAYNGGNTITTTSGNNIAFTLASGLGTPTSLTLTNNSTADAFDLTQGLTSGTSTNGFLVNINGAGGTTTNGIQVEQSAGTLTNGITLSGTIANGIDFSGTNFTNLITATNFTVNNSGNLTTAGTIADNGGSLTTTAGSANLFNTTATTLNIGGAATTLTLVASSGTATINNAALSLPHATAINATSATTSIANLLVTDLLSLGASGQAVAIFNQHENEDILTASCFRYYRIYHR